MSLVPERAAAKHAAAFLFPPLHRAVNVFICARHFFPLLLQQREALKKKLGEKKDPGTCLTEKGKGFKVLSRSRG